MHLARATRWGLDFLSCPPRSLAGPERPERPERMKRRAPSDLLAMSFDDMMPEIGVDLVDYQEDAGAVFGESSSVPLSYGNNSRALFSIEEDAAVIDASDWSRLRISGPGAEQFLHGQLSVDVKRMAPGSGREACLLTPRGQVIDLVLLLRMETGFLMVCSPSKGGVVTEHLEKHIFAADDVLVKDVSSSTALLRLVGPKSNDIMYTMNLKENTLGGAFGTHEVMGFDGRPLVAVKGSELGFSGYSLIVDESAAGSLWKTLVSGFGATPMGSEAWGIARVMSGRPAAEAELAEPVTALEAGLYHTVSLNKGCYVGQEALAKMYDRDADRKELWGLRLQQPCSIGDGVYVVDGHGASTRVGKVTSHVDDVSKTPVRHCALAFLKKKKKPGSLPSTWNNASVFVGEDALVPATVTSLPYATRELRQEDRRRQ
jgi:folate-binding protein YgfZ